MVLFLTGFMGCGKSYCAEYLASKLGFPHYDTDHIIENEHRQKIAEIFKHYGEAFFRSLERDTLTRFLEKSNVIVATGGGALLNPEACRIAKQAGKIILIDTPFEVCYARIQNDTSRPNAANRSKEELWQLYQERYPKYCEIADHSVDGDKNIHHIVKELFAKLELDAEAFCEHPEKH